MIHRIYSTDSRFKELAFKPGFNVVLAEKSSGARRDQTRNASGKSSMLEIIHYLLGSKSRKDSIFSHDALSDHTFGMEFDLSGHRVRVHRTAGSRSEDGKEVFFTGEIPRFLQDELPESLLRDEPILKIKIWNELLGREAFGTSEGKRSPTFRMAFPYFCRVDSDGGIQNAFESWSKQPTWQRDVTIAFLLGLDWKTLSSMEELRQKESHLEQLRKELKGSGIVGQVIGETRGLRAKLAVAEQRVTNLETQLENYQVLPEYREIETEASDTARKIADLSNRNTADRRLIADLEEALATEKQPAVAELDRLYASAGIQLPGVTLQRLESVKEFHQTIIRNRRSHLQNEIKSAHERIASRESEAAVCQARQEELMGLLQSHGALDQYNKLQEELSRFRSERDILQKQFEMAQKIERGGADLEVERATLHQALIRDFDDRAERLNQAALLYADLSKTVSERSSILEIEPTSKGLQLAITGGPSKSKGIREQQIFCFDMLLAVMQSKRPNPLGFVVHDSHLFDAMEERQVANAIEAGAHLCEKHGFQYIITMNSDRIPYNDFSNGFDFDSHIIEPRLTDDTETGGLFGFRFESKAAEK